MNPTFSSFERKLYGAVGRHPFLCVFLICLMLTPFCWGAESNITPDAVTFAAVGTFAAAALIFIRLSFKGTADRGFCLAAVVLCGVICVLFFGIFNRVPFKGIIIFILLVLGLLIFYIFSAVSEKRSPDSGGKTLRRRRISFFIIALSFAVRLLYILTTSVYTRQNDVHSFGGDDGHAAYIEYYLFNKRLPDFDVREVWQFYHPPLHHIICAFWIDIFENVFGADHNMARESLQMLTLFYSAACVILVYRILRYFRLNGKALYLPLAVFGLHPSFILLSGSINNDILSLLFTFAAVLAVLRWRREPTAVNICAAALAVGLGMMTKLSAGLAAPAVAALFIIEIIRRRREFKKYIGQYFLFGIICVPLALWWEIRNFVMFKVPINYIPKMDKNVLQYIGDIPYGRRLTDFSAYQFSSVFEQWNSRGSYCEFNPTIALMKNSLFGESLYEVDFPQAFLPVLKIFFIVGNTLALLSVLFGIVMLFFRIRGLDLSIKAFFTVFCAVYIVNFYIFCRNFPFTCTENFRYIAPTLLVGVLSLGVLIRRTAAENASVPERVLSRLTVILSALFCVLSLAVYITLSCWIDYSV